MDLRSRESAVEAAVKKTNSEGLSNVKGPLMYDATRNAEVGSCVEAVRKDWVDKGVRIGLLDQG